MSGHTFKVGDRVRTPSGRVGRVRFVVGPTIDVAGTHFVGDYAPEELTPAPPMSPEARMVWHAMRAGAKRENGHVVFGGQRKRLYSDGDSIFLSIYTDLPPAKDGGR